MAFEYKNGGTPKVGDLIYYLSDPRYMDRMDGKVISVLPCVGQIEVRWLHNATGKGTYHPNIFTLIRPSSFDFSSIDNPLKGE